MPCAHVTQRQRGAPSAADSATFTRLAQFERDACEFVTSQQQTSYGRSRSGVVFAGPVRTGTGVHRDPGDANILILEHSKVRVWGTSCSDVCLTI